jgi:hypothetical protein
VVSSRTEVQEKGHLTKCRGHLTLLPTDTSFVVAAFVVDELKDADRAELLGQLRTAKTKVLVVEPISSRISPWWREWGDLPPNPLHG